MVSEIERQVDVAWMNECRIAHKFNTVFVFNIRILIWFGKFRINDLISRAYNSECGFRS